MPNPLIQWFTNAGAVADTWGLCVFRAGTSTLATTYTTAALSVSNANPVRFNSAGRASSGGVFLTPGESYLFDLRDFTGVISPTCIAPVSGTTIWTVDNVQAVPGSAGAVDVTGTAGETIVAGEAVYLSNGTGGLNTGQWYKTDADLTYRSTSATLVGIAPNAIASGNAGSIRISGAVTVAGPLATGSPYYAGATAGAIVTTPPTNAIRIGTAQSATSFLIGFTTAPVAPRGPPCGRLTLTSGLPVTTADVTAATTIYYTPAGSCNTIFLYDGTAWSEVAFAQLSIAVPATTNQMYDVFAYDSAGVVTLELTAWTNDTTRATALVLQNGVYSKTGVLTRRYLGSFRTTAVSGQTEDSMTKRHLWNYYNRVTRAVRVVDTTDSWTYTLAAFRQANNSAANQVDLVCGVAEDALAVSATATASNSAGLVLVNISIGEDSATVSANNVITGRNRFTDTNAIWTLRADLVVTPAVGRHYYAWLEYSNVGGTTTWTGDGGNGALANSGMSGLWRS